MKTAVVGTGIVAYHVCYHLATAMGRDVVLVGDANASHRLLEDLPDFKAVETLLNDGEKIDEVVVIGYSAAILKLLPEIKKKIQVVDANAVISEESHSDHIVLHHGTLYGPGIEGKVTKLATAAIFAKPLVVYKGTDSYCMIFNLNKAIQLALESDIERGVFNITDDREVTNLALAHTINMICNRDEQNINNWAAARSQVIEKADKEDDDNPMVGSIAKAKELLKYDPIPMKVGLQAVLRHIVLQSDSFDAYTRDKLVAIINFER